MRVVIQRVSAASVIINKTIFSEIEKGLLILVGVGEEDSAEDIDWLCHKIIDLRIFADEAGKMNVSLKDINGDVLLVSQFTLFASTKKGNRPSYIKSTKPETAIPLYELFIKTMTNLLQKPIKTGVFGADMQLALVNDGPVTIMIDSKNRE